MNVLIIRNAEASTNANIRRVVSALLSAGHKPIILSRARTCQEDEPVYMKKDIIVDDVRVDNFELQLKGKTEKGLKNITTVYTYIKTVTRWMMENIDSFEAIHAFDLDSGLAAHKLVGKKYFVYHIADFYADSRAKIPKALKDMIKKMEFDIIKSADHTIICTDERKKQIEGSKPKKLSVVYNSPSIDKNMEESINSGLDKKASDMKKLKLSYIGMLSKRRFIDTALEVISEFDDVELTLAGSGDLLDMSKEYAEKYDNIHYIGKIPYEKTFDIYKECNLMFAIYNPNINNHRYSAANKIYEAMLLNKAIVVAKNTSMDEIVDKHDIGFSIDYSKESFRELINKLRNNLNILDEKSGNMKGVYEDYSWEKMKQRLVDIYAELGDEN
ncbi:MAG: glycosyltransferase [Peptostreptococcus sp.]|uniref:glycosyltransferase n=1 Tax=Peptostreptococcus sp. TaxID=1262 RepID=UPI002FC708B7